MKSSSLYRAFWRNPLIVLFASVLLFMITSFIAALAAGYLRSLFGLSSNSTYFFYGLIQLVSIGLIVIPAMRLLHLTPRSLGIVIPQVKYILAVIPVFVLYGIISGLLMYLAAKFLPGFDIDQVQKTGFEKSTQPFSLLLAFFGLVVFTPIVEEFVFRGILFKGLRARLPFWFSALVVSGIFAFAHGQWNVAIDTFALGMAIAYLVEKSGSIVPAILMHMLKNGTAFVVLFLL